jgi:hypothetical protein
MPSTAQRPSGGSSTSPTTTLSIILIIAIPSIFLVCICFARQTPLFASVPGNRFHAVRELTRPSKLSKSAKLQPMPVLRYNKKLSAALHVKQDIEAGGLDAHQSDSGTNTSTEDLAGAMKHVTPFPIAQPWKTSFVAKLTWLPLPAAWKEPKRRFPGLEHLSYSAGAVTWAKLKLGRKQAVQCCAICTEDFRLRTWVRRLPCAHIFHPRCIDPWLVEFATTCPLW